MTKKNLLQMDGTTDHLHGSLRVETMTDISMSLVMSTTRDGVYHSSVLIKVLQPTAPLNAQFA